MRDDLTQPTDVLVIGAGPAGTAAAALMHRAGFSTRIVEQTHFPRFVIGESLLPHCMDVLDDAGLLEAVKARNYLVKNGALFFRGPERCSFSFAEQVTKGWTWTWQVPRADFDKTLADAVADMGVPIHYGHTVRAASFDGPPAIDVVDESGGYNRLHARFVIDASGYGRVLPRLLDLEKPSNLPERMALFTHVRGDQRPPGPDEGRIWICIHPQGAWIWIIPFSNGVTSVGAVSTPDFFEKFPGDDLETRLRAILASEAATAGRLKDATFEWTPRILRGYSASVKRVYGPNYALVGNATEFLDPVFSSGVTLALESSHRATSLAIRELRGETIDWERDYGLHMARGTDVFRTFVTRWYDGTLPEIFFAARQDDATRRRICSVLAGYVWDEQNPMVRDHRRKVPQLARVVQGLEQAAF